MNLREVVLSVSCLVGELGREVFTMITQEYLFEVLSIDIIQHDIRQCSYCEYSVDVEYQLIFTEEAALHPHEANIVKPVQHVAYMTFTYDVHVRSRLVSIKNDLVALEFSLAHSKAKLEYELGILSMEQLE